jgi:hypothetical protein
MNAPRFDRWTRSLTGTASRRSLLGFGSAALGLAATQAPGITAAKKKKRKKPSLNAFGCLNVGQACRGDSDSCCSGICQGKKPKRGKKDKSRCIAHNVGTCQAAQDACQVTPVACGSNAACFQTTGQASFCADALNGACANCREDRDCQAVYGADAACIVCASCPETSGTACLAAGA